jgi:hypothetical protein
MLAPYSSAVQECMPRFAAIGLAAVRDSDYLMELSNGQCSIELVCERYYHPSLSVILGGTNGKRYNMGSVMAILAPDELDQMRRSLREIRERSGLDRPNEDLAARNAGIEEFAMAGLDGTLRFIEKRVESVLLSQESFRAEYEVREAALLKGQR